MNTIILISIVLSLIAQLIGFRAYFNNSNLRLWFLKTRQEKEFRAYFDGSTSYGATVEGKAILLPPAIFIGLTMALIVFLAMMGWGSDDSVLPIFGSRDRIPIFIFGYFFFGALINLFASTFFFVVVKYLLPPQQDTTSPGKNANTKLVM